MMRSGRWKLHFPHSHRSYAGVAPGRDGLPGPYAQGQTGLELYDLEDDISETKNVADKYPLVVEQLKILAEAARDDLGDTLTKRNGKNVRPPGRRVG